MATKALLTGRLRRKLDDWKNPTDDTDTPVRLADEYYWDALDDALGRLNSDLVQTYTLMTLPLNMEWVILILAAISLIPARIHAELDNIDVTGAIPGRVQRVIVQGLDTSFHVPKELTASDWLRLADQLEEQYQNWLEDNGFDDATGDGLPVARSFTCMRENLRNNRSLKRYEIDEGVTPPADLTLAISAQGRYLVWSNIYNTQYSNVQIERKISTDEWEDANVIATIYDNHTAEFTDTETLDAGTYMYRLKIVNRNNIKTYTSAVSISLI